MMKNTNFNSTFNLLNVGYVKLNKTWDYYNVISPFYRIYLIDDGFGSLGKNFTDEILEKGFMYLVPSFTICNHHCPNNLSQFYIHIQEENADGSSLFSSNRKILKISSQETDLYCFRRILELNPGRDLGKANDPREYEKQSTLAGFHQLNNSIPLSGFLETKGLIFQLLSRFLTFGNLPTEKNEKIPHKILDAINFIHTNLHEMITVDQLAKRANQNAQYFSRTFQQHTGVRLVQYIHLKRIERAQFLICTTDLPLSRIAFETGFESISYFSKIFKTITGQTPGNYKITNDQM